MKKAFVVQMYQKATLAQIASKKLDAQKVSA